MSFFSFCIFWVGGLFFGHLFICINQTVFTSLHNPPHIHLELQILSQTDHLAGTCPGTALDSFFSDLPPHLKHTKPLPWIPSTPFDTMSFSISRPTESLCVLSVTFDMPSIRSDALIKSLGLSTTCDELTLIAKVCNFDLRLGIGLQQTRLRRRTSTRVHNVSEVLRGLEVAYCPTI